MFTEFPKYRFVCQISNILGIVKRSWRTRALVGFLPVTRLAGKYAFTKWSVNAHDDSNEEELFVPFRIHSRLKSAREHCNFFTA